MACTRSRSFLTTLCMAVATAALAVTDTVATVATTCYVAFERAISWVVEHFTVAAKCFAQPLDVPRVAMALVQARAFVLRLAKRETPRVTPGWRMCPSI